MSGSYYIDLVNSITRGPAARDHVCGRTSMWGHCLIVSLSVMSGKVTTVQGRRYCGAKCGERTKCRKYTQRARGVLNTGQSRVVLPLRLHSYSEITEVTLSNLRIHLGAFVRPSQSEIQGESDIHPPKVLPAPRARSRKGWLL